MTQNNQKSVLWYDARRKPAWRAERVKILLGELRPPDPRIDDQHIIRLYRYYRDKHSYENKGYDLPIIKYKLHAQYPLLWHADDIYSNASEDRIRYVLEACLLARMSIDEIHEWTGVDADVIDLYKLMYFDIEDRIKNHVYISTVVLAQSFMSGLSSRTDELTLKYFAYFAGKNALKLIMHGFYSDIAELADGKDVTNWLDDNFKTKLRVQGLVAAQFMEPNNFNIRTLFESYQGIMSLQFRDKDESGSENTVNRAVDIFSKMIQIPLGSAADVALDAEYQTKPNQEVTLRVADRYSASMGENSIAIQSTQEVWESPGVRKDGNGSQQEDDNSGDNYDRNKLS
jgi:hypothetical protein